MRFDLLLDHSLGVGEAFHDPRSVIIEDAVQDNLLKITHCQAGVLPVIGRSALLEIRLNDALALQMLFVAALDQIKELFHLPLELGAVGGKVYKGYAKLGNLLEGF